MSAILHGEVLVVGDNVKEEKTTEFEKQNDQDYYKNLPRKDFPQIPQVLAWLPSVHPKFLQDLFFQHRWFLLWQYDKATSNWFFHI